jgi:hypothetical protein
MGSLGFLANILCFVVLIGKQFDNLPMYSYLRVYSVNSGLLCLISIFAFVASTRRLFPALNCYGSNVYFLWIYLPCAIAMQVMTSFLDIAVTMDRIGFFNKRVKAFMDRTSPRIVCLVLFPISCLIGSVYYAQVRPFGIQVGDVLDTSTGQVVSNFVIWASGNSEFANSAVGRLFFTVWFFVRESILMTGEIVPNCVSLYYLKGYYDKMMTEVSGDIRLSTVVKQKTNAKITNQQPDLLNAAPAGAVAETVDEVVARVAGQQMTLISQADRNATVMVFVLCSVSIITHSVTVAVNVYGLLQRTNLIASSLVSQVYGYATSKFFLIYVNLNCDLFFEL